MFVFGDDHEQMISQVELVTCRVGDGLAWGSLYGAFMFSCK